jgi:hypothetical protein
VPFEYVPSPSANIGNARLAVCGGLLRSRVRIQHSPVVVPAPGSPDTANAADGVSGIADVQPAYVS